MTCWVHGLALPSGGDHVRPKLRYVNYNQHAVNDPNTTQYASNESLHNLFVSILGLYGMDVPHFGSNDAAHTGPLPNFLG